MAKRAVTSAPTFISTSTNRSKRIDAILGRDWKVALPFVLPLVVIMVGLIFWPFVNAILLSFTTRNIVTRADQFVGFKNYQLLWKDADFRGAVGNTVIFTVASVVCKTIVGMAIALLLNSRLPFRNVLTGVMLLPWIVPEVVTAMAWRSIYDPIFGGLNPILEWLGLIKEPVAWLSNPKLAMPSVISVNIWKGIPFYTILLLAGLKAIDKEQYEAAEVDGATAVKRFRHITLPSLKYVLLVTILLSTISTFNTFGLVYLMTGGGPGGATRLYSILDYERAIVGLRFGPGAAVAFSLAPVLALVILLLARFMRHDPASRTADTRVDRAFGWVGRGLAAVLDVIFLPFEWIADGVVKLFNAIGVALKANRPIAQRDQPLLKRSQREGLSLIARCLLMLPLLLFVLFPFYWIVITSFKTDLQIQQFSSIYWPSPWTLDQFRTLLFKTSYLVWFRNTVIVAVLSTIISVSLAALAGYALARLKFLGASALPLCC